MDNSRKIFSLDPIIDDKSQVLVLGSIPGKDSISRKQYYANPRNQFWDIIFSIFGKEKILDYPDKVSFLSDHKIALWDVIHSCSRNNSLDSSIKEEEPNDIQRLLSSYPNIKLIVFNGGKAYKTFKMHIGSDTLERYESKILPSTSPTPGKYVKAIDEKLTEWKTIMDFIN